MTSQRRLWITPFGSLLLVACAQGAVINNPTLVSGTNAIDPAGAESVDLNATGARVASQASLEADPLFSAIQNFAGFTGGTANPQNIVSFTSPEFPDLSFSISGTFVSTGGSQAGANATNDQGTSAGSNVRLRVNTTNGSGRGGTLTYTIDFGDYNGSSFDGSLNSIRSVAFTLAQLRTGHNVTVRYYNPAGTVLETQTATGSTTDPSGGTNGTDFYFGFNAAEAFEDLISKVEIEFTAADSVASNPIALDDLGFAQVPEPGPLLLLAALASALLLRRGARPAASKMGRRFGRPPQIFVRAIQPRRAEPMNTRHSRPVFYRRAA